MLQHCRIACVWLALATIAASSLACSRRGGHNVPPGATEASGKASAALAPLPPDRLAPGELAKSAVLAFGFPVPAAMTVERAFPNEIHLVGEADIRGLMHYVQSNAQAGRMELKGNRILFETVHIPSAGSGRTFRIELWAQGRTARLLLKEITLSETPKEIGVTDAERWRRAGMKPNGEPLDISQLR